MVKIDVKIKVRGFGVHGFCCLRKAIGKTQKLFFYWILHFIVYGDFFENNARKNIISQGHPRTFGVTLGELISIQAKGHPYQVIFGDDSQRSRCFSGGWNAWNWVSWAVYLSKIRITWLANSRPSGDFRNRSWSKNILSMISFGIDLHSRLTLVPWSVACE